LRVTSGIEAKIFMGETEKWEEDTLEERFISSLQPFSSSLWQL
jgi:hypothetical protein